MRQAAGLCFKCGKPTTEERCRFSGQKSIADKEGNQIVTTCPVHGFLGFRPVEQKKANKTKKMAEASESAEDGEE